MRRKQAKAFLTAALLLVAGSAGGVLLAGFATNGASERAPATSSYAVAEGPDRGAAPVLASADGAQGPRQYVCHGCGPSLAEQQAKADARRYQAQDGDDPRDFEGDRPYPPPPQDDAGPTPADRHPPVY